MTTVVLLAGIGLIFVSLFLVLGAVGGLTKEATGVGRSLQVLEAMTSVPDDMRSEGDAPFSERVLLPLLARSDARVPSGTAAPRCACGSGARGVACPTDGRRAVARSRRGALIGPGSASVVVAHGRGPDCAGTAPTAEH